VDIVSSFLLGFISMWFALRMDFMRTNESKIKQSMIDMANHYSSNHKICKELKDYSLNQIKNGHYEYMEVIDVIKRQNNDKTRA